MFLPAAGLFPLYAQKFLQIAIFTITLIKSPIHLCSTILLLFFSHVTTFNFSMKLILDKKLNKSKEFWKTLKSMGLPSKAVTANSVQCHKKLLHLQKLLFKSCTKLGI